MTAARDARLASLMLDLRMPLARAGLAASQLSREVTTPAGRELALGISDAVAELDLGIERGLDFLAPASMQRPRPVDCRALLRELRTRLAPVLHAGSLQWDEATEDAELLANPHWVRRGAIGLLQAARSLARGGGHLELTLEGTLQSPFLLLQLQPHTQDRLPGIDPWEGVRLAALTSGGALEVRDEGTRVQATLWLSDAGEP